MMLSHLCALILFVLYGVFGVDADEVKSVSVTEGDSVTLNTDVTEVQRTDQILWMFGPQDTHIAVIYKQSIDMFDSNEIFRDRLKMDSQTGSLTITDIRNEHSGLYKLTIMIGRGTSYKRFSITVYAHLPVPVIISKYSNSSSSSSVSRCSVLCSVLNVSAVSLSWYKGNSLLSSISVSDLSISLSLPLEVEYQDKNPYSCVVNNTITNHTTHLDISQTCSPDSRPSPPVLAVLISASVVILVICGVMLYLYIKSTRKEDGKSLSVYTQVTYSLQRTALPQVADLLLQH